MKPKFFLHTAEFQLLVETQSWQMDGDYPQFHATIQTYKLFISGYFHGTLLIKMLKALDPYLQRKVIKKPRFAALEETIEPTWRVLHTAQTKPQYYSHRLPTQLRHRTPRQLPRPYMYLQQRPQQSTCTISARRVRIRAPSHSEPLTKGSEALEYHTHTYMPFQAEI